MEVAPPITKQPAGTTFLVSVGIVGAIAVLELGGIAWAFLAQLQRHPPALTESNRTPAVFGAPSPGPATEEKLTLNDPLAADSEPSAPMPAATPEAPALPKPTPVSVARKEPQTQRMDRAAELVEQARLLRDGGDTLTALTRLREAQAFTPDNPQVISEMAITYEKMGVPEKAKDQWRRIYLMGESAGIYYAAADAKLNALRAPGESPLAAPGALGETQANLAVQSAEPSPAVGGVPRDALGFQPNATLAMADLNRQEIPDGSAQTHFNLKIPVKSRPGSKVDVHEVVVQVFFYDLLDDRSVVQTSASVNSQWTTAPTDWADDNLEILEVEYNLPKPDPRDPTRPNENRKYHGYVVRIYYKKDLQDMRAEPMRLLQLYPPPARLESEESR